METKERQKFEKEVLDQLMSGKNLFGEGGAFAPMLKNVIEKALQAEMDAHLDDEKRSKGNKRNGKGKKTLKSSLGSFEINTPQDRHSDFEPELVKKRQTILADNLSDKIIGMYGIGMSYRCKLPQKQLRLKV
jgi:transposase-like protein